MTGNFKLLLIGAARFDFLSLWAVKNSYLLGWRDLGCRAVLVTSPGPRDGPGWLQECFAVVPVQLSSETVTVGLCHKIYCSEQELSCKSPPSCFSKMSPVSSVQTAAQELLISSSVLQTPTFLLAGSAEG